MLLQSMLKSILLSEIALYYIFLVLLMVYMFKYRKKAIIEKRVSIKDFRSYKSEQPEDLIILQNHFNNQFQIPVFYVLAATLSIALNSVTYLTITLSTIFILSRFIHTFIHLGPNNVLHRAYSFFIGVICVGLMFLETGFRSFLSLY